MYSNVLQAVDDGSALIVVTSQSQQLFSVDPNTGVATEIDLGGELLPGAGSDGLVRGLIVVGAVVLLPLRLLLLLLLFLLSVGGVLHVAETSYMPNARVGLDAFFTT